MSEDRRCASPSNSKRPLTTLSAIGRICIRSRTIEESLAKPKYGRLRIESGSLLRAANFLLRLHLLTSVPLQSMSLKPLILFFTPVRHATEVYKALSNIARTEVVTSKSREEFFKDVKEKYRDAQAIYRTSASGAVCWSLIAIPFSLVLLHIVGVASAVMQSLSRCTAQSAMDGS